MIRMSLVLLFSLCVTVFSASAVSANDRIDYSETEAQERLQIIKELTYRLDTKITCTLNPSWDDAGSGADLDGYFFIPSVGQSEYIIGGFASQNKSSGKNCVVVVSSEPTNNPEGTPRLLATPIDWKQIWKDKGSGAKKDGSMWEAIPPDSNYRCLGSISQLGYHKPNIPNYRCVHSSLTEKIVTNSLIWSDKGSGANNEVTMFKLPNTGSFITVEARISKTEAYDLKVNAVSTPDPELVEEKLVIRMEKNQQVLKAQKKTNIVQKRLTEDELIRQIEDKKRPEVNATSTPTVIKDKSLSSSLASPTVSENQKSDSSYFTNLARKVTGWLGDDSSSETTEHSVVATIGIRGLGAEELRIAHPDTQALQKMDSYAANTSDAAAFAKKAQLVAKDLDYLELVTMEKTRQTTTNKYYLSN